MTEQNLAAPSRHRSHRQRGVRHPRDHLLHRAAGPPGRRFGGRPARRHRGAVRDHRQQAAEGAVRLLPADRRRRGADVRRRPHPRLVLPPGGPPERGRDPHLPAHRPAAAPGFAKGLRNEVQVVATVLALDPRPPVRRGRDQRRLDVDQAVRPAVLRPDRRPPGWPTSTGQWVAFPTHEELERATFDMVVAGRVLPDGDVAIMMVEAEATAARGRADRGRRDRSRPRRSWPAAWRRPSRRSASCAGPRTSWPTVAAKPVAEFPVFLDYQDDVFDAVAARGPRRGGRGAEDRRQGGARGGPRPDQGRGHGRSPSSSKAGRRRSSPRSVR